MSSWLRIMPRLMATSSDAVGHADLNFIIDWGIVDGAVCLSRVAFVYFRSIKGRCQSPHRKVGVPDGRPQAGLTSDEIDREGFVSQQPLLIFLHLGTLLQLLSLALENYVTARHRYQTLASSRNSWWLLALFARGTFARLMVNVRCVARSSPYVDVGMLLLGDHTRQC